MALTVAITERTVMGNKRVNRGTIAFDSSYPTGGEAFTAANMGLKTLDRIEFENQLGYMYQFDYTNNLVLVYVQGVAIGSAGALTIDDYLLTGVGSSTTVAIGLDAAATTPVLFGPMKEAASTTDLSTLTGVRWVATGI